MRTEAGNRVTVFLYEPNIFVCKGLEAVLTLEPRICFLGSTGDARRAAQQVAAGRPEILVAGLRPHTPALPTDLLEQCAGIYGPYLVALDGVYAAHRQRAITRLPRATYLLKALPHHGLIQAVLNAADR